jgi:hypothetical protein
MARSPAREPNAKRRIAPPMFHLHVPLYRPAVALEDDDPSRLWLAREPTAPLAWPVEACFIAAETASQAYLRRYSGWRMLARALPTGAAMGLIVSRAHDRLEVRRARSLGLTIESAPTRGVDCASALVQLIPLVLWRAYVLARGMTVTEPTWPYLLAQRIIREISSRRDWQHARSAQARGPTIVLPDA